MMYSHSLSLAAVGLISADANETLTAYGGVKQDEVMEETRGNSFVCVCERRRETVGFLVSPCLSLSLRSGVG